MSATAVRGVEPVEVSGPLAAAAGADHKRLGVRLGLVACAFFALGGIFALIMRSELAHPGLQVVSTNHYNELFTLHGSTMIYLFMTPVALAAGVVLVPLQVGATAMAGARFAVAAFWLIVGGGLVMESGLLTNAGAAQATWIGIDPLSQTVYTPSVGQDMWILAVGVVALGELILAACVLATVVRRRAPGMTLLRMPPFTWAMVVTCLLVLAAFPALVAAMGLSWADRHGAHILTGAQGALIYQHLFWFYGHPVVYVMFFPFLGMAAEVVAAFSGRRWFGYRWFVVALLAFAGLSASVWAHHMFTTGRVANDYFSLTSTALIIPAGIEYIDAIGTMWGGRIRLTVPMLFALGFFGQFLIGGLSGIAVASSPLDYQFNNSYFVVAHFHYTLFAGSLFGLFAGLWFWWPKLTGRRLPEPVGRVQFVLLVIGANLTFFPQFLLGADGMPRRIADYPTNAGWTTLNLLSTIGAGIIALGILTFLVAVAISTVRRRRLDPDPWDAGQSLEWWTSSPPPVHNFDSLPPVRSHAPLLDLREEPA